MHNIQRTVACYILFTFDDVVGTRFFTEELSITVVLEEAPSCFIIAHFFLQSWCNLLLLLQSMLNIEYSVHMLDLGDDNSNS